MALLALEPSPLLKRPAEPFLIDLTGLSSSVKKPRTTPNGAISHFPQTQNAEILLNSNPLLNLGFLTGTDSLSNSISTNSSKPTNVKDLHKHFLLRSKSPLRQLTSLLISPFVFNGRLAEMRIPTKATEFKRVDKVSKKRKRGGGKRFVMIPRWVEIGSAHYSFDENAETYFGGYGAVAFFQKSNADQTFPELIALKVGVVSVDDLEELIESGYCPGDSKAHWTREFLVQMRLQSSFMFDTQRPLPFPEVFAASLGRFQSKTYCYSAMQAGLCDLFDFGSIYPLNGAPGNASLLLRVMQSCAESLARLHSVGLHHGDVKLANILVSQQGDRAMIADFDGSVFLDENLVCETYTEEYISPQRRQDDERYNCTADDCWAMGIAFLILTSQKRSPLEGMSLQSILNFDMGFYARVHFATSLDAVSCRVLEDVICGLLTVDETRRLTADEAARKLLVLMPPLF